MHLPRIAKAAKAAETDGPRLTLGRRRILSGVGASGLMAAAGIFASSSPAAAADNDGCCNLANKPGSAGYVSRAYCTDHMDYVWVCSTEPGYLRCSCCETAGNKQSSYWCYYG